MALRIILLLLLFSSYGLTAQCPNFIGLASQEDVDNFINDYPECGSSVNQLYLFENTTIDDLSGLSGITTVNSILYINASGITNLDALGGLQSVASLSIQGCSLLTDISAIAGATITGNLSISGNTLLSDCNIDLVCDLLADRPADVNISNNTGSCNSNYTATNECLGINCPSGDVSLASQQEIVDYAATFDFCQIQGNLTISGADINDLTPLNNKIERVSGNVSITLNSNFTNAPELEGLTRVDGTFTLTGAPSIQTINMANDLHTVGERFTIKDFTNLTSLSGFGALTNVPEVRIENSTIADINGFGATGWNLPLLFLFTSQIDNISGFNGLTTLGFMRIQNGSVGKTTGFGSTNQINGIAIIGAFGVDTMQLPTTPILSGSLTVQRSNIPVIRLPRQAGNISVTIEFNSVLRHLIGFQDGGGTLQQSFIRSNGNLRDLDFLAYFTDSAPNGSYRVIGNSQLKNTKGLSCLRTVEELEIRNNNHLDSLILSNLFQVTDSYKVEDHAMMTYLSMPNLTYSPGVGFKNCDAIVNFAGFPSYRSRSPSRGGSISFTGNQSLQQLGSYPNAEDINNVGIYENSSLNSLLSFENPLEIQNLAISRNGGLVNPGPISGITRITGFLEVRDNPNLEHLPDFQGLLQVSNTWCYDNSKLVDFTGLGDAQELGYFNIFNCGLTSVQGFAPGTVFNALVLFNCNMLSSLIDLAPSISVTEILTIINNDLLEVCNVVPVCNALAAPGLSINISGNAVGCTSIGEVQSGCLLPANCQRDIVLSQATVNSFPDDYFGCSVIVGNITTQSSQSSPLVDISPLTQLVEVRGNFFVGASTLSSLEGLHNLEKVTGNVIISAGQAGSISGTLDTVGGDLQIFVNDGGLALFQQLKSAASLEITGASVTDFSQLGNLSSLTGGLTIRSCDNLISFTGLEGINDLAGSLWIENNASLESISALSGNSGILANVKIENNETLSDLSGLRDFSSVTHDFIFRNNDMISNLGGPLQLSAIGGDIIIEDNEQLASLNCLSNVSGTTGNIKVRLNPTLTSLSGTDQIGPLVDGYIDLSANDGLTDIDGFNGVLTVDQYVDINDNLALTKISGLSNFQTTRESFTIQNNPLLADISGPENFITAIEGLGIGFNASLSICEEPWVCDYLISSGQIQIISNMVGCNSISDVVNQCNVLPVTLSSLTATPTGKTTAINWQTASESQNRGFHLQHRTTATEWATFGFVAGQGESNTLQEYEYTHQFPAPGDNYYRLLQEDFDGTQTTSPIVSVSFSTEEGITLFPNPVSNALTLTSSLLDDAADKFEVNIRDAQGRTVMNVNGRTTLNVANLPKGVYLLTLTVDQQQTTKRFIKQ